MNMAKLTSAGTKRFSCPGCEAKNFHNLIDVKNHFVQQCHTVKCPKCQKVFKQAISLIQHYQKYDDFNNALQKKPTKVQQIQTSKPVVKLAVASSSRSVQNSAADEAMGVQRQGFGIPEPDPLSSSLVFLPLMSLERFPLLEVEPRIATQLLDLPTILHPLEQDLIFRYLCARCHPLNRLQAAGYILEPTLMGNKRRSSKGTIEPYLFRTTPPRSGLQKDTKRRAVAIDCEMVEVANGHQALAFLGAIDFLNGDVLINNYVRPDEDVVDWRSDVSGVTHSLMSSAIIAGEALGSWQEARQRLWNFIDDSTVLVGHSLHFDLEVLGICHTKVVDSAIFTAEAVFHTASSTKPFKRAWSLKTLAREFLNLDIQISKAGHSALEDAYAARDVVIWCIRYPEQFKAWVEIARAEEERKVAMQRQRKGKKKGNGKLAVNKSVQHREYEVGYDEDSEILHWSDIAEGCGWPHPDTGYDPWSD
ncbi:hypothetical protein N7471_006188 [Penicillium samsonianum]|uniref:uncharacterized protein n=1 Tax=Penicillium samsonianum TaxID=1882272 RepID=UPI0025497A77|nr:uncharacterized protein N7471_006188 [Penicillium samsonianum]KAJ6139702.1 hypothetical protein N7471_006188 [Penicillium samsonianum]